MAYTTRSKTKVSLPASLFAWLMLAWLAAWLATLGLWLLAASTVFGSAAAVFQGWTLLLTQVVYTSLAIDFAVILNFYYRPTLVAESNFGRFFLREVLRSKWFLTSAAWFILVLAALVWTKTLPSNTMGRISWLMLVAVAPVMGYRSTSELRRVYRSSITTPLFADGLVPAPSHDGGAKPLWRSLGPDWAAPQHIRLLATAQKYHDVAKSRAATLNFTGRAIATVFSAFAITALPRAFASSTPSAVGIPVALGCAAIFGWWLDRRAADVDKLADMYGAQVHTLIDTPKILNRAHRSRPHRLDHKPRRVRRSRVAGRR